MATKKRRHSKVTIRRTRKRGAPARSRRGQTAARRKATRRTRTKPRRTTAKAREAARARKAPKARTAAKARKVPKARKAAARQPKVTAKARRPAKAASSRPKAAAPTRPGRAPRQAAPSTLGRSRRVLADAERLGPAATAGGFRDDRLIASARAGHGELQSMLREHTETSPALAGGDVDAKWQDAYAVGDEAPGGDNPTPGQDRVDDIGRALGVNYRENQELQGGEEITKRDRRRWELDPGLLRRLAARAVADDSIRPAPGAQSPTPEPPPRRRGRPSCRCSSHRARPSEATLRASDRNDRGLPAPGRRPATSAAAPPVWAGSLARRRARSSGAASRNSFTSASGKTTVPISRPSMTMPPSAPSSRWRSTSTARTGACRATIAAAASISGVRMARVTSCPSIATPPDSWMSARRANAATDSAFDKSSPSCSAIHATARYIAPVST